MGIFSFITDFFSKPKKKKPAKKTAKKKAARAAAAQKKAKKPDAEAAARRAKKKGAEAPPNTAKPNKKKKGLSPKAVKDLGLNVDAKKKGRKKSKKISAEPIDEKSLGFSISLKGEDQQSKKRDALRIRVNGLSAFVHRLDKHYDVTDVSASGLGFAFEKPRMKGGVKLKIDLYLNGELQVEDLQCKVMRHDRGSVGCIFIDLDRHQDDKVHALVLQGQKEQAERRAARKDSEFTLPS